MTVRRVQLPVIVGPQARVRLTVPEATSVRPAPRHQRYASAALTALLALLILHLVQQDTTVETPLKHRVLVNLELTVQLRLRSLGCVLHITTAQPRLRLLSSALQASTAQ